MKARFPGSIGKGFYPSVIKVSSTIEDYLVDALSKSTLSNQLSNCDGSITTTSINFKC